MQRMFVRFVLIGLLVVMLSAFGTSARSHAATSLPAGFGFPLPPHSPAPQHSPNGGGNIPKAIDSDITVITTATANNVIVGATAVEGHMLLSRDNANANLYTGTFIENTAVGKKYPASADTSNASAPILTINSHVGRFVLTMDGNFGSASYNNTGTIAYPTKIGPDGIVQAMATVHSLTTNVYNFTLVTTLGVVGPSSVLWNGTLTVLADSQNIIVPKDPTTNAISSLVTHGTKGQTIVTPITASGVFDMTPNSGQVGMTVKVNGKMFVLTGKATQPNFLLGTAIAPGTGGTNTAFGQWQIQ